MARVKNAPYLLALHSVDGLGPVRLKALLDYFKDPKLVWEAKESELLEIKLPKNAIKNLLETRKKLEPEKYLEGIGGLGIKWMTIFDEEYPPLLKQIYDPPIVLFYKGTWPKNLDKTIAIVGTRRITSYGQTVTQKFAKELSESGLVVVSGLARGVDTIAHQTAIQSQGQTIAVLGGGLNHIFPAENVNLAKKIYEEGYGVVISEFPPSAESAPGNFPARNRVISGLSKGVLVTEAAEDSGSLITARCALEQSREVYAIPGPITSDQSKGALWLLKQGAKLVTEPSEILEEMGIKRAKGLVSSIKGENMKLSEVERKIVELLEKGEKHVDEICRESGLPTSLISASLVKMEIHGLILNNGSGFFSKS